MLPNQPLCVLPISVSGLIFFLVWIVLLLDTTLSSIYREACPTLAPSALTVKCASGPSAPIAPVDDL